MKRKGQIVGIENAGDHMSLEPHHFQNKEGFEILKELASRKGSRFKILGNSSKFEIKGLSFNIALATTIILITWFFFFFLVQDPNNLGLWIAAGVFYLGLILLLIFAPTSYSTYIDITRKKIKIQSNNEFAKPIRKSLEVRFDEIEKIDFELQNKGRKGMDPIFHKIKIHVKGKSKPISILRIPHGPWAYVNQRVLVYALFKIIRGEEETSP